MAQFVLLLHEGPNDNDGMSPEEIQRMIMEYRAWSQSMGEAGHIVGGQKLTDEGGRATRAVGQQVLGDRRAMGRSQGGDRRLLPHQGHGLRRGGEAVEELPATQVPRPHRAAARRPGGLRARSSADIARRASTPRRAGLASRPCAASPSTRWSTISSAASGRLVARLVRVLGPAPRPRRGGGAGRDGAGAQELALLRHSGRPRRLADARRPQPRARRAPARRRGRRQARGRRLADRGAARARRRARVRG